jgi:His/Glu/Gln/Arg/opine family amino acid ABC transporter permease subunit
MHFDAHYFLDLLWSGDFLAPVWTAVWITFAALLIGIVIGTVCGIAVTSQYTVLHWPVRLYLIVFRGTPLLVQIIFWYDALPELTGNAINLSAIVAGVIALGVNEGAYMTEIVRAGLGSVDRGQREAAHALGLSWRVTMFRVILPQAARVAIPATGNQVINLLKNTSLLFTVAITEIFATGTNLYSASFKYFEVLAVVSIWYIGLSALYGLFQRRIEARFSRGVKRVDNGRDKNRDAGSAPRSMGGNPPSQDESTGRVPAGHDS